MIVTAAQRKDRIMIKQDNSSEVNEFKFICDTEDCGLVQLFETDDIDHAIEESRKNGWKFEQAQNSEDYRHYCPVCSDNLPDESNDETDDYEGDNENDDTMVEMESDSDEQGERDDTINDDKSIADNDDVEDEKKKTAPTHSEQELTRYLPIILTNEEYDDFTQELAAKEIEKDNLENELKTVRTDYKHRLEQIGSRIKELSTIVQSRKRYDNLPCTKINNWKLGSYSIIRDDTGEVVEKGEIPASERQRFMFDEE